MLPGINAPIGINTPEIKPSENNRPKIKTSRDQFPMGSMPLGIPGIETSGINTTGVEFFG